MVVCRAVARATGRAICAAARPSISPAPARPAGHALVLAPLPLAGPPRRCFSSTRVVMEPAAEPSPPSSSSATPSGQTSASAPAEPAPKEVEKKKKRQSLASQAWDAVLHVYHGARLLAINTKVALTLQRRVLAGNQLTRKEKQLLNKTAKDLIRMVPFSFFIIIPGAEVLLPVALMMFPDMMPSTFVTKEQVRKRQIVHNLTKGVSSRRLYEHMLSRVIIDEGYDLWSPSWGILKRVGEGDVVTAKDVRTLSQHFQPGHKLHVRNLPGWVLTDVSKVLGVYHWFGGTFLPRRLYNARLRAAVQAHYDQIQQDDKQMVECGIDKMTHTELEDECAKRGMRFFGTTACLKIQLQQWCEITQDPDVPSEVLAFVRPCATNHKEMLKHLSDAEVNTVLGLKKYEDSPMKQRLMKLTKGVTQDSSRAMDKGIMEEEVDDIARLVDETTQQLLATEEALSKVKQSLKSHFEKDYVLELFHETVESEMKIGRGSATQGVHVPTLARLLHKKMTEKEPNHGLSAYRLVVAIREFDLDTSNMITEDEFVNFLARIYE